MPTMLDIAARGTHTRGRSVESVELGSGFSVIRMLVSQEAVEVLKITKPIPAQLLEKYCQAAIGKAQLRQFDDGTWYAEIPGFEGVWAREENQRDALNVLNDVLLDWLLLKIEDGDRDIPVVRDIDLNCL